MAPSLSSPQPTKQTKLRWPSSHDSAPTHFWYPNCSITNCLSKQTHPLRLRVAMICGSLYTGKKSVDRRSLLEQFDVKCFIFALAAQRQHTKNGPSYKWSNNRRIYGWKALIIVEWLGWFSIILESSTCHSSPIFWSYKYNADEQQEICQGCSSY
jgi:hypothetical protein